MRRILGLPALTLVVSASAVIAQLALDAHGAHRDAQVGSFVAPANEGLPPSAADAVAAIDRSPRHGEWVEVASLGGTAIRSWVVYPERRDKAPVVIVIHANQGLNDWARALADQLAEDGFIAVAPDLLSGLGPNGGATDAMPNADAARKAIGTLTPSEVTRRLDAVRSYALTIPAASGRVATMGFCWGGSRSFEYAVSQPALDAAVVFYGSAPQNAADLARIEAPILGLYGGDDARVNATIEPAAAALAERGKTYEYEIFEGAGHGFVAAQADRNGANYRATAKAWPRALAFLVKHLSGPPKSRPTP